MTIKQELRSMLVRVASALGDELRSRLVFVGGCTTALLVTDDHAQGEIRYTHDVDLIVDLVGYAQWAELQEKLSQNGFTTSMSEPVICRMLLGDLKVDFMPTDSNILGFTNKWYEKAITCAEEYALTHDLTIRILPAPIFMATKFEAYSGRGNNDPLGSHDMEDILWLIDGRSSLLEEIQSTDQDVKNYLAQKAHELINHPDVEAAISGNVRGDEQRTNLIFAKLEKMSSQ
jgi:predicted nucleotidyltransferase